MNLFAKSLSLSIKLIFRDPINLVLSIIPSLISLALYIFLIVIISSNFNTFSSLIQSYIPHGEIAGWIGNIVGFLFIIFVLLLMNWTYIILVGLISTPFNSVLSARIESYLSGDKLETDRQKTLKGIFSRFFKMIRSELFKLLFILGLTAISLVLNLFPFFYPISIVLLSFLLAIQFLDFSWSRHHFHFMDCFRDLIKSFGVYGTSGFFFLILMSIPFINSLVPAMATGHFTILWMNQQKRIQL
jgi:CysZ protein